VQRRRGVKEEVEGGGRMIDRIRVLDAALPGAISLGSLLFGPGRAASHNMCAALWSYLVILNPAARNKNYIWLGSVQLFCGKINMGFNPAACTLVLT
jgi:hypothetical protein